MERPGEDLKLYGEWINELCAILQITKAELCRQAQVNHSTLSENMRTSRPDDVAGVYRIWEVFEGLAIDQQKYNLLRKRDAFLNAADVVTKNQKDSSQVELAELEQLYPPEQYRRARRSSHK